MFVPPFYSILMLAFLFLATSLPGLSELNSEGENVCGPRRHHVNVSRKVREVVRCPTGTGSCPIYRTEFYITSVDVYYCCSGYSQTNTTCSAACGPERFGENCTETCTCPSKRCNPIAGECQCAAGKQGTNCSEDCSPGRFGIDCEGTCDCPTRATCDVVNGTCYESTTVHAITTDNANLSHRSGLGASPNSNSWVIIVCTSIPVLVLVAVILFAVWKFYLPHLRTKEAANGHIVPDTGVAHASEGHNGNIAPGTFAGHHNDVLPPRSSTGAQVELDPKYTSVQITTKDASKASVPNRQNTSGQPGSSKGLPTYAKVDKSQGKSMKGSKPPTAQKPLSKSKTLPAKERSFSESNAEQSKPPPAPYASTDETVGSRRKSDNLPAYASIDETLGLGDDAAFSSGIEDAAGKENAYDLLNPETMKSIENYSTQQPSATSQDDSVGGSSPYDVPAAAAAAPAAPAPAVPQAYASPNSLPAPGQAYASPNSLPAPGPDALQAYSSPNSSPAPSSKQFTPPSTSQKNGSSGESAYGVTDLSKKDLSRGEIEVQQKTMSLRPLRGQNGHPIDSTTNMEVSGLNHHYATLDNPNNVGTPN